MKPVFLFFIFSILFFTSCTSKKPDIYRTANGSYTSKEGGFSIKFPLKPDVSVAKIKEGSGTYFVNMFKTAVGTNKKFRVTYIDYPKEKMINLNKEDLYTEEIQAIIQAIGGNLKQDRFIDIKESNISGKYFTITRTHPIPLGDNFIEGKIFLKDDRLFIVTHSGLVNEESLLFMESFEFMN